MNSSNIAQLVKSLCKHPIETSAGSVSRLITDCVERHVIKPLDPDAGNRYMQYIPYWA